MSATGIEPDELGLGDRVEVFYVMYEDSCPTWVHYFDGVIREDLGGGSYLVRRDDTGALKQVSNGATCSVRPAR